VTPCPPHIPHGLTRERTRASALTGQRLTAWATTGPYSLLLSWWIGTGQQAMWLGQKTDNTEHKYFTSSNRSSVIKNTNTGWPECYYQHSPPSFPPPTSLTFPFPVPSSAVTSPTGSDWLRLACSTRKARVSRGHQRTGVKAIHVIILHSRTNTYHCKGGMTQHDSWSENKRMWYRSWTRWPHTFT
jgi:hypothetical protein